MKKYILSILSSSVLLFSCGEADKIMYHAEDTVNFEKSLIKDKELMIKGDTIIYSFAFEDLSLISKKIAIPVELTGFSSSEDRCYHIEVEDVGEAKADRHYEALSKEQIFHKDLSVDSLYVNVLRAQDLIDRSVKFKITMLEGGDFKSGIITQRSIYIQVSDVLEEPLWWENWVSVLGPYYPVVYRKWMEVYPGDDGKGDLTGKYPDWWKTPQEMTLIIGMKDYYQENPTSVDGSPWYEGCGKERIVIPITL